MKYNVIIGRTENAKWISVFSLHSKKQAHLVYASKCILFACLHPRNENFHAKRVFAVRNLEIRGTRKRIFVFEETFYLFDHTGVVETTEFPEPYSEISNFEILGDQTRFANVFAGLLFQIAIRGRDVRGLRFDSAKCEKREGVMKKDTREHLQFSLRVISKK
ncbi:hypothetical protein CEXT_278391 [Caerostris extrusa]|uniref:Uncharacterized protein n=1 Tax=Caerostris extrusa TaxID=172846 RepID=A0AAV4S1G4_CAEEX|nr:hypothetical protein CEXT_278391 [Caerostris extrusa]